MSTHEDAAGYCACMTNELVSPQEQAMGICQGCQAIAAEAAEERREMARLDYCECGAHFKTTKERDRGVCSTGCYSDALDARYGSDPTPCEECDGAGLVSICWNNDPNRCQDVPCEACQDTSAPERDERTGHDD